MSIWLKIDWVAGWKRWLVSWKRFSGRRLVAWLVEGLELRKLVQSLKSLLEKLEQFEKKNSKIIF